MTTFVRAIYSGAVKTVRPPSAYAISTWPRRSPPGAPKEIYRTIVGQSRSARRSCPALGNVRQRFLTVFASVHTRARVVSIRHRRYFQSSFYPHGSRTTRRQLQFFCRHAKSAPTLILPDAILYSPGPSAPVANPITNK